MLESQRNPLRTGIMGIILVVCVVLVSFGYSSLPVFATQKSYQAYFADASGIVAGNEVNVSGIKVGKVSDVVLVKGAAKVTFTVDRKTRVGDQSLASIRSETLLGSKSLAIKPAGKGTSTTIPLERTSTPYSLSAALQELGQNSEGIDKRQFTQALSVLTGALHDATPQLRGALDGVADLSRVLNDNDEALAELLRHASGVSRVLSDRASDIDQLIVDGSKLFAALDERRDAISALIQGIGPVSQQLSGFVADNRKEFGPALTKLNLVLDNLLERREYLSEALRRLPPFATTLGEVVASAPGFQVMTYGVPPPSATQLVFDGVFQPNELPQSLADFLRGFISQRIIIRPKSP